MDNSNSLIRFSEERMAFYIGEHKTEPFFWDLELYDANFDLEKSNGFGPSTAKIRVHKGEHFVSGICKLKYNGSFNGEEFVFLNGSPLELDKYEVNFFDMSARQQTIKVLSPSGLTKEDVSISFVYGEPGYDLYVEVDDDCNIVVSSTSMAEYEIHFSVEYDGQKKTVRVFQKIDSIPMVPFVNDGFNVKLVGAVDDSDENIRMSAF